MYLERLPGLQAQLQAYRDKTQDELMPWRPPAPVPTTRKCERYEHFFSWATHTFMPNRIGYSTDDFDSELLAIFGPNPNHKLELRQPGRYVLVRMPYGTVKDAMVIFKTSRSEPDSGTILNDIQVIKGVVPELPWAKQDAREFTQIINREIAQLYLLAIRDAHRRAMNAAEREMFRLI